MRNWLLPESIDDVLPAEADAARGAAPHAARSFRAHGYRLVQPPLIEHLDSLLTGSGRDLELQTFKVVDPLSGRLLGVRADITPQVARIDAHLLNEPASTRLCYAGSVLRAVAAAGRDARSDTGRRRALRRAGHRRRPRSDRAAPLVAVVARAVRGLHLDLGHVGVYRALANGAGIAGNGDEAELFAALRTKDVPAVRELTTTLPAAWRDALAALPTLYGPAREVLAPRARDCPTLPSIANALDRARRARAAAAPHVEALHIDLADLRGYHYQNGAIFSVFTAGEPTASATAAATMASARRSAAHVRRPVSRSTCASSPTS